ncbi:MAG: oxidoreductase, partial [Alphaproteobacteria bacterium]
MTQELAGRVAIVTGASNGLGRGIAQAMAAAGAKTIV